MEQLVFADHVLAGALTALSLALVSGAVSLQAIDKRTDFYKSAMISGLALPTAVLAAWLATGRPLADFGLHVWLGDTRTTVALGAAWLAIVALYVLIVSRGAMRSVLQPIYERFEPLMPRNRRELWASWATSAAAGCGEEIVYRGFLLWYGTLLVGAIPALLIVTLLFGAAHGYQSRLGMAFATLAGLVLGIIYVASGSLALVMWAHTTYNMASFFIGGMIILREQDRETGRGQPANSTNDALRPR